MLISTPVSLGELVDKLTILEIKSERIADSSKLENIVKEKDLLGETLVDAALAADASQGKIEEFKAELKKINEQLWEIEDDIRECERAKDFSGRFVELARNVYITNDKRAAVKNAMNLEFGSALVEEKSYESY